MLILRMKDFNLTVYQATKAGPNTPNAGIPANRDIKSGDSYRALHNQTMVAVHTE